MCGSRAVLMWPTQDSQCTLGHELATGGRQLPKLLLPRRGPPLAMVWCGVPSCAASGSGWPTCWNSCDTTDWKRSTTSGLGGGGPWLHVMTGCLLRDDTSILQAPHHACPSGE